MGHTDAFILTLNPFARVHNNGLAVSPGCPIRTFTDVRFTAGTEVSNARAIISSEVFTASGTVCAGFIPPKEATEGIYRADSLFAAF